MTVTIELTPELADLLYEIVQFENEMAAEAVAENEGNAEELAEAQEHLDSTNQLLAAIRGDA